MAIIRIFDNFVEKTGDEVSGNIVMLSGANLYTSISGVNTLGSPNFPFEAVYADSIIGSGISGGDITSGVSLGYGEDIFAGKNGSNLEFNTVSGAGLVSVTVEGNTVVFSGAGDGTGDVVGPASATDDAIAVYDGTTGKLIKNSSSTVADIVQNTSDIVNVSGIAVQNTTDIATVSGIAIQNQIDITNISGISSTAIQSGVNLGTGDNIFSAKNGTDLEFRTVSGVGNITVTIESDVVVFSGTEDGMGDVVGPASATDNAVAVYDGTTGKLIKNSSVIVDPAGTINANTVSGTNVNADVVTIDNLNGVIFGTSGLLSGSATTTQLPEGTNLYYTDQRVNDNPIVSGHSISIAQNTTDIATVSGITVVNAGNISQNVTDIATVSGIATQNTTDIATVSGIATQNTTDIANVSGVAFTAIQSGTSLGGGDDIFSAKNGTDLEFRTVSGVGNISLTIEGDTVVFSGTGDGAGDVVGPASATDDAIAVYDGTTGKLIKNSTATVADIQQNTTDIGTVSGIAIQNQTDIVTVSGIATQNQTDIVTVSGLTVTNSNNIAQNTTDIATVSGIAIQNQTDIATVSGIASTAIQSGVSLGDGDDIFSAKNGTDLEFRTVSGVGNITVTIESDTVVFSGTGDGAGDVVGPASATDDAIAVYDGTTGKLIKNSTATVADIQQNTTDIGTVSGIAVQNQADIITVSGLTVTNANNIAQNVTDIATVSGIAVQNQSDIANVSGVAFTAIQSGVSLGAGDDIFSAKNGTDLEFRTVSGVGNISVTIESDVVVFSGTENGTGDVVGPASATDNAVAVYDGTTGKLIQDSAVIINPSGTLNANVLSGTTISGSTIELDTSVSVSGVVINHVFGTELNKFEELFVTTTTSTTPQVKVSGVTGTLPAGQYRVGWSYAWNHNSTTTDFEGRVLVDGSILMEHKAEPTDSAGVDYSGTGTDQKYRTGGQFYQDYTSAATHTFVIDYATSTGGNESSIWDARIEIWRTR